MKSFGLRAQCRRDIRRRVLRKLSTAIVLLLLNENVLPVRMNRVVIVPVPVLIFIFINQSIFKLNLHAMNKNFIFLLSVFLFFSCTDNYMARHLGGTETIELKPGEKLVNATWKDTQLWYLTEPMPTGYIPKTKIFHEKSQYGAFQGSVIFVESGSAVLKDTIIIE